MSTNAASGAPPVSHAVSHAHRPADDARVGDGAPGGARTRTRHGAHPDRREAALVEDHASPGHRRASTHRFESIESAARTDTLILLFKHTSITGPPDSRRTLLCVVVDCS